MSESLILNTLAFDFPKNKITFYFSNTDRNDAPLTRLSYQLFPNEIQKIFPGITTTDTIYTSFDRKLEGFTSLEIDFSTENFALIKRYFNREIKHYFTEKDILVEPTFVKDNQIWLRNTNEKAPDCCQIYDRYTLKLNFNHFTNKPELVVSYDRKATVLKKSVAAFISEYEEASADLLNRVVHVQTFKTGHQQKVKRTVTKYDKLNNSDKEINYKNVYPVLNNKLAVFLGLESEEEENPYKVRNRYTNYYHRISAFYSKFLNNEEFRKIIPVNTTGFDKAQLTQIGKTLKQSKQLVFGKNQTDVIPQRGVNYGPFSQPKYNNIQIFYIFPKEFTTKAIDFSDFLLKGYKSLFKGLLQYTNVPVSVQKNFSIPINDTDNPLKEIELELQNRTWNPNVKYIAVYLTSVGKHAQDKEKRKIYYKVKEKLLNRNITSQCIETDKMLAVLENDAWLEQKGKRGNNFAYTLQNISIAINAKLGGVPWRINIPEYKELVVGVGAFKNIDTNIQYIASAFSFDNTGAFNSFDYFHSDQTKELAGSIEDAIISYASVNNKPSRLVIHFYKEMSEKEIEPIQKTLHKIDLDIPVFVVTINKTESEDFVVFDTAFNDLMPYSGTYINLGNKTYLLCNNTRYEDNSFKPMDGFPFPVKLKIDCPTEKTQTIDTKIIDGLINQVYQFSRIYWKSVKQQNLPVTVKYPEMVAQIAPHFDGGNIPDSIGKDNLWFL